MTPRRLPQFLALIFAVTLAARAEVRLPGIFSDNLVLQQGARVPVWGWADDGEVVTVSFRSQIVRAKTKHGKWLVKFNRLNAGGPDKIIVEGKNRIELNNVLVGEVWICSGQSNIEWPLDKSFGAAADITASANPMLRLFLAPKTKADAPLEDIKAQWKECNPESSAGFSAVAYYFGRDLQKSLNVPVGLIETCWGGSPAEVWMSQRALASNPVYQRDILDSYAAALRKTEPAGPKSQRPAWKPAELYNGMISPLIPFAIKGAIWYQGESNEARAQQYGILLPTMIKAWRERWGEGNFPFGIVQLPNYRDQKPEPADEAWSFLREAQRRTTLTTPNSGLIVTIDIGEAHDIHPKNKLDVGKRMALWALADVYGRKLTKSGPMFRTAKIAGSKIILTFDEAGEGLRIRDGDKLDEFAIAGADRKWHWANARIVGKDRIEVWLDSTPQPLAVRYAFNNNPRHPNLTNETGLPAAPFRTDDWPGPTDGKR